MMSNLTKETVAAALDAEKFYLIGKPDLVKAKDHDTIAELSRQQREFIKMVRDYYLNLHPEATKKADALLALWPDDPTEENK